MKILIAADMEGVAGVVHWDQVDPTKSEYDRFCSLMTAEVNVAVNGLIEAGAQEVVVTDGHNMGRNIKIEELDNRAKLNSGTPLPHSMVQGIDEGVDGVIFLGYHARAGSQNAILDHTWSARRVANVWINEELFGEIGLNAALCGHFGVPVIMITGDQTACSEAQALIGPLETVIVKRAWGRSAAECLHPDMVQEMIRSSARKALTGLKDGKSPPPLKIPAPIKLTIEFSNSEMADNAALFPGSVREDRRISFTAADMESIYTAFTVAVELAG